MSGTNHGDILPGGKCAWHRFDPSKYLAREFVPRLASCALPQSIEWDPLADGLWSQQITHGVEQ